MQKDSPTFSIIMPAFNAEQFLERSIGSLLNQTNTNFEFIMVDDGSKDRTLQKAKELLANASFNYKLIRQSNSGVSTARNMGLREASGEYVCFLDGDDELATNMVEIIESTINGLSFKPDALLWQYENVIDGRTSNPYENFKIKSGTYSGLQLLHKMYAERDFWISVSTACYRRQLILQKNILFPQSIKIGEDQNFLIKFFSTARQCTYIPITLYRYYYNPQSATKKISINFLDYYFAMKDACEYITDVVKEENSKIAHEICRSINLSWIPRSFVHGFLRMMHAYSLSVKQLQNMIKSQHPGLLEKIKPLLLQNNDKNFLMNFFIKLFSISPSFTYLLYKMFRSFGIGSTNNTTRR